MTGVPATLVRGGTVLTMDPQRRVIPDAAIVLEDDQISWIGASSDVSWSGGEVIDATGCHVVPGLVNVHTHVPQILLRGSVSEGRQLYDWLLNVLGPGLARYTASDYEQAAMLFSIEALRGGITTIVANEDGAGDDFPLAADNTIRAYTTAGIRVVYARMLRDVLSSAVADAGGLSDSARDQTTASRYTTDDALAALDLLYDRHHGANGGLIEVWPSPATTISSTDRMIAESIARAEAHGTPWTMHVAETEHEREINGCGVFEWLQSRNLLRGRLLAAHCVDVTPSEIPLMAAAGVTVATQVGSNGYLGSGVAPVPAFRAAGIAVGFGTDDANCNDAVSILKEMRLGALLHRAVSRDATALSSADVLAMATIEGATALGMEDRIGSIEVGKQADLVVLALDKAHHVPIHDPVSTIVQQTLGNEPETVIVGGQVRVRQGRLTFLDAGEERALLVDAQVRAERLAAGLEVA